MITAEEFLIKKYENDLNSFQDVVEHLKEFTNLHCIEVDEYINKLKLESFVGWSEDSINGYLTALETIKDKLNTLKL